MILKLYVFRNEYSRDKQNVNSDKDGVPPPQQSQQKHLLA